MEEMAEVEETAEVNNSRLVSFADAPLLRAAPELWELPFSMCAIHTQGFKMKVSSELSRRSYHQLKSGRCL
jgi:hypothetical protein